MQDNPFIGGIRSYVLAVTKAAAFPISKTATMLSCGIDIRCMSLDLRRIFRLCTREAHKLHKLHVQYVVV